MNKVDLNTWYTCVATHKISNVRYYSLLFTSLTFFGENGCVKRLKVPELWLFVLLSQAQVAVLGEEEDDDDNGPDVLSTDVQPRPGLCDPRRPWCQFFQGLREKYTTDYVLSLIVTHYRRHVHVLVMYTAVY